MLRGTSARIGIAIAAGACAVSGAQADTVRTVTTPPLSGGAAHFVSNKAPLRVSPLVKLPTGAIRPEGWLRGQLTRMANGFSGRLTEISPWCKFEGSAWASKTGQGKNGWEELPYWLKGYTSLGYVLQERRIIAEARRWIDAILASQRPDGYFGPESNRKTPDVWPNMLALCALRTRYEATGDKRVIPFMKRYFRWQASLPLERFLPGDWQKWRGGDNLDSIYWLYNRTGEKWLLELARVNHERTADWVGGIPTWHGVNLCQGFREPAQYFQQTGDVRYLQATERNLATVMGLYGQVPGGMFGADENARPGYNGPRQAAETCSMAEIMASDEMLAGITGDAKWADHCEDVAFNSLPASMTPDLEGLHYLTAPNMIQLDRASKSPMLQNGGDMLSYNPADYRCCQHNAAFGWPYFAEHLWMATQDGGLAAVLFAPNSVTATAASGTPVTIRETTDYPFRDTVTLEVNPQTAARFPLYIRRPAWCNTPVLTINGVQSKIQNPKSKIAGWLVIDREWRPGDRLVLKLPMVPRVTVWKKNRNTVSVSCGPLTYSLKIGERWQRYGGTDRWPACEVFPTTAWNYGLELDAAGVVRSFKVSRRGGKLSDQPFTPDATPVTITAKARRIPAWKQEANGLVGEVVPGPVHSDEPVEEVTLIPMGCARLRISAFPVVTSSPDANGWEERTATVEASFIHDSLDAVSDGILPANSADTGVPRFTWWDHVGTEEWLQVTFGAPRKLSECAVYWFDDEAIGGQCRTPESWRLLWWDGAAWQPVSGSTIFGTRKNALQRVRFDPVETTKLRLEVKLRPDFSAGVFELQLGPNRLTMSRHPALGTRN